MKNMQNPLTKLWSEIKAPTRSQIRLRHSVDGVDGCGFEPKIRSRVPSHYAVVLRATPRFDTRLSGYFVPPVPFCRIFQALKAIVTGQNHQRQCLHPLCPLCVDTSEGGLGWVAKDESFNAIHGDGRRLVALCLIPDLEDSSGMFPSLLVELSLILLNSMGNALEDSGIVGTIGINDSTRQRFEYKQVSGVADKVSVEFHMWVLVPEDQVKNIEDWLRKRMPDVALIPHPMMIAPLDRSSLGNAVALSTGAVKAEGPRTGQMSSGRGRLIVQTLHEGDFVLMGAGPATGRPKKSHNEGLIKPRLAS